MNVECKDVNRAVGLDEGFLLVGEADYFPFVPSVGFAPDELAVDVVLTGSVVVGYRHVESRRYFAIDGEVAYCIDVGGVAVAEVGQVLAIVPCRCVVAGSKPCIAVLLFGCADDDVVVGIALVPVAEAIVSLCNEGVCAVGAAPLE